MNLYKYLEEINDQNFLNANGLFLYKGLLSRKDVDDFCKKNNFRLLKLNEFQAYLDKKEDNFFSLLEQLNLEQYTRYKIYIDNPNYSFYIIKKSFMRSIDDPEILEGITLLKYVPKEKTFKKIEDIKLPHVGLSISMNRNITRIICYDNNLLSLRDNPKNDFIHPILFYGAIENRSIVPYESSTIAITAAREDVSGSNILYPILAYYSNHNLLIPDRGTVSDSAYLVWDKFHRGEGILKTKGPIDDFQKPVTPQAEDDGEIHYYKNYKKSDEDILNNKEMSDSNKEEYLIKLREKDPLNWVYFLSNSEKDEIGNVTNYLEINDNNFKQNLPRLLSLAVNLYDKRRK